MSNMDVEQKVNEMKLVQKAEDKKESLNGNGEKLVGSHTDEDVAAERRKKAMDPKHRLVFGAIENDDIESMKKLILEEKIPPNITDHHNMTMLLQAAYKGNYEMCEFLLNHGSDVNITTHKNLYTPLMMAAIAGKPDVIKLLLNAGASVTITNSIDKTAAELSGFVGQHECASLIKNYLSIDRLMPYYTPQGENKARIEKSLACELQALVMAANYHPVKIVLTVNESTSFHELEKIKKSVAVLDDLCRKCVRTKDDFDEVLALKLHYVSYVLEYCRDHRVKKKTDDLGQLLKWLLKENGNGIKLGSDQVVRQSLTKFPYTDLPLLQYLVKVISQVELGENPSAVHCLQYVFNGVQAMRDTENWCQCCANRKTDLRCGACKEVRYCNQKCQKLHWFIHKKKCEKKTEK